MHVASVNNSLALPALQAIVKVSNVVPNVPSTVIKLINNAHNAADNARRAVENATLAIDDAADNANTPTNPAFVFAFITPKLENANKLARLANVLAIEAYEQAFNILSLINKSDNICKMLIEVCQGDDYEQNANAICQAAILAKWSNCDVDITINVAHDVKCIVKNARIVAYEADTACKVANRAIEDAYEAMAFAAMSDDKQEALLRS